MSKAAQRALEAYPQNEIIVYGPLPGANEPNRIDDNLKYRIGYAEGYEQAEKDLALTWGDVQLLDFYAMECQVEESKGRKFNSSQEFFEEVLRRFNKTKEE